MKMYTREELNKMTDAQLNDCYKEANAKLESIWGGSDEWDEAYTYYCIITSIQDKRYRESCQEEFDAFYHFDLSINVCKTLFKEDFQVFMSSHNTMLLSNDFIRPDCGFIIGNNKIDAICNLTSRGELRQGHNIEKMYRAGSFDIK